MKTTRKALALAKEISKVAISGYLTCGHLPCVNGKPAQCLEDLNEPTQVAMKYIALWHIRQLKNTKQLRGGSGA